MAVRDILSTQRPVYTNIILKGRHKHVHTIHNSDVVNEVIISYKKDGTPVTRKELNVAFWESVDKPCDIVYDEAHSIINSRNTMSRQNQVWMQWVKLIRKMIGGSAGHYGEFIWIAQLPRNIDIDVREMTPMYCYHVMWSTMVCRKCGYRLRRNSEMTSRQYKSCLKCGHYLFDETDHVVRQWEIRGYDNAVTFQEMSMKMKLRYPHRCVKDIAEYFGCYDTMQYEDLHN